MLSAMGALALAFAVYVRVVHAAAAVTFYDVSQEPAPSAPPLILSETISISAGPVGVDGVTTYVQEVVESFFAEIFSDTTEVFVSTPTTFFFAIAQSTGGYMASAYGISGSSTIELGVDSCTFDATGHGVCVDRDLEPQVQPGGSTVTRTVTFTRSGSVVPYYTLAATPGTGVASVSTSTGVSATLSESGGAGNPTPGSNKAPVLAISTSVSLLSGLLLVANVL
ncbi:hypothetical protein C8F01DRAFT_1376483 [Mycena amicta]|nr:hypothetical protein C8F01DRAFT_1376483 [Mycena amicta]